MKKYALAIAISLVSVGFIIIIAIIGYYLAPGYAVKAEGNLVDYFFSGKSGSSYSDKFDNKTYAIIDELNNDQLEITTEESKEAVPSNFK
jgi:hypothetical protein